MISVAELGENLLAQVLHFLDLLVRLAYNIWKQLRALSLRDLLHAVVILLTDRIDYDLFQAVGSRVST